MSMDIPDPPFNDFKWVIQDCLDGQWFAEVAPSSFSVAIVYLQCRGSGVLTMLWAALSSAFFGMILFYIWG